MLWPKVGEMHVCRRVTARALSLSTMSSNNDKLQKASALLQKLQQELVELKQLKTEHKIKVLTQENVDLRSQIDEALKELVQLETLHGKKQIPIPNQTAIGNIVSENSQNVPIAEKISNAPAVQENLENKPSKETKPKKAKPEKAAPQPSAEAPIDVGRLDFRIGKIVEISKHPDADSLYVEKVDCGEPNVRTVVSGLVNHIPIEEMQNRIVVLLCNLKPVKMRGVTSEAMVMCASSPEKVEVLTPPPGSMPGDLVHCEGFPRNPDPLLNPKKKVFETCAPDLLTNSNKEACFKNVPLVIPGKGKIVSQTLTGVNVR